jgi:hypothetical protein
MFRTEGVGLKRVTNQKGKRVGEGGGASGSLGGNNMHCANCREAVGKLQGLQINKISVIQIAKADPSLIRGFQNLHRSYLL